MPLVLHDNPRSSNAQKVRFLLAELGQTAELREVPFAQPRPDWHLAVNPLGGIPAIIHDDFELAESNTILRYLATRSGDTQIYPSDLPDRATVNWLLDAIATYLRPALLPIEEAAYGLRAGGGLGAEAPAPDGGARRVRRGAAEARALPGPARRRLAVGLLRPLHDRGRRGDPGAPPPAPHGHSADRDPAPRRRGPRPAASAPPGRASPATAGV